VVYHFCYFKVFMVLYTTTQMICCITWITFLLYFLWRHGLIISLIAVLLKLAPLAHLCLFFISIYIFHPSKNMKCFNNVLNVFATTYYYFVKMIMQLVWYNILSHALHLWFFETSYFFYMEIQAWFKVVGTKELLCIL
jgi:hypothetical protein